AQKFPHAVRSNPRISLPGEQDRGAVVGFEHASEIRRERAVRAQPRVVRRAEPSREAPFRAPLGDEEAASLGAGLTVEPNAPGLRRGPRGSVERFETHPANPQLAAKPAAVIGSDPHDPIGESDPVPSTDQPTTWPASASIA